MAWIELLDTDDLFEAQRARRAHAVGTGVQASVVTNIDRHGALRHRVIGEVPDTDPRVLDWAKRVLGHVAS